MEITPVGLGRAISLGRSTAIARATAAAAPPDRTVVAAYAATARPSAIFSAPDFAKGQARARVQQVMDRLKVLKKLFANDPKGMAKALAQAFKELKAAVRVYAKAMGDEFGMTGGAVNAALAQSSCSEETSASEATSQPGAHPYALYDAVAGEVRKGLGEEGLSFLRELREVVNALSGTIESARTQMRARKPEKAMTEAFDDADASMRGVRDALADMERDIHADAPLAGMRVLVAA